MAIAFWNIKSKEIRVADTEPMIAALWGSSDRGPNVSQGQDFGWRLAPSIIVEMRQIAEDEEAMERVARRLRKDVSEVTEPDILDYISARTSESKAAIATDADFSDEYNEEIRRLERKRQKAIKEAEASEKE